MASVLFELLQFIGLGLTMILPLANPITTGVVTASYKLQRLQA